MKASETIDRVFFEKKFSATKYLLRYIVAAPEEARREQLSTVSHYRDLADQEIAGVVDANYSNFNASLGKFAGIANQLQDARGGLLEVEKRSMEGKAILTAKTKNLHDLLLQTYEAKKVIDLINDIEYIEKAPAKIQEALDARKITLAVDVYSRAFDLVFSDKLVVFSAVGVMRHALLESKQTIEDYLLQALGAALYLHDVFSKFGVGHQQSLRAFQDCRASVPPPPLEELAQCVQRLSRDVEVAGTLKLQLETHLERLLVQVTAICRQLFEAKGGGSGTFGSPPHAPAFQAYLRTVLDTVYDCLGRHSRLAVYFAKGVYSLDEIVRKAFHVVEEWLVAYLRDVDEAMPSSASPLATANPYTGLFCFFTEEPHKETNIVAKDNQEAHDGAALVCSPSLYYVPVIFDDIAAFSAKVAALQTNTAPFVDVFWRPFVGRIWFPKLQAQAQVPLLRPLCFDLILAYSTKHGRAATATTGFDFPLPLDTVFAVPNVHALAVTTHALFDMLAPLAAFESELIAVVESTARRFVEDCAAIVRKVCEGTLNQVEMSIGANELARLFHSTPLYQAAKGKVPYLSLAKVTPTDAAATPGSDEFSTHANAYTVSYSLPTPIITTTVATPPTEVNATPRDELHAKESDLEAKFVDPAFWARPHIAKSLVSDASKVAVLAYMSSCCDFVALHLEERMQGLVADRNNGAETLLANLKATSWRCSGLADECLFFLRREVHLACYYHLTQVAAAKLDAEGDPKCSPLECVLALRAKLLAVEEASLQPYLAPVKVALVLDGLDGLVAGLVTGLLAKIPRISKAGVAQMHCNLLGLQQVLTGLVYKYQWVRRDAFHLQRAMRYYSLVLLPEAELEMFLMENRKAFPAEALRAVWRVDVPTRALSKASVNKLDSLLR
ncbi:exocyst complex component 4 [Achlya hypogyna]|uniref:Exocyst complex component Sec8 n=1 Tax=Achlya hypogyna TaxID=1202772 RepID=A0A1V9YEN1_ACHHY|nr:exocyst complex component 4 [Achlya hypogyna]